jgi:uncharacterized protein DUF4124
MSTRSLRSGALGAALAAALLAAAPVAAQVYKCVDASGRTTYQGTPCAAGQRGSRVELILDNGSSRDSPDIEAQWAAAARSGSILNGMPKRWVQQAFGQPSEIRVGGTEDKAGEVWTFPTARGVMRVGFLGGAVVWTRNEFENVAAGTEPTEATAPEDTPRARVAVGQDCDDVLGKLGAPESQQSTQILGTLVGAENRMLDAVRYTYPPDGTDGNSRLTFSCANGKIGVITRAR